MRRLEQIRREEDSSDDDDDEQADTRSLPATSSSDDWEEVLRRTKDFFDDGSVSFSYFWRKHNFTVLLIFCAVMVAVASYYTPTENSTENRKRGLLAVVISFLVCGVTVTPDGPFRRPHPAVWRLILCLSIAYELGLIFLMFQTADEARHLMTFLDPELGKPLPEKDYAGSCVIYDSDRPDNPLHNVYDKFDVFVPVHFFGWWVKTLILRDLWLCNILSIMFEVLEYSLEHQLPNFSECWWDHWIMDIVICNGMGIYLGLITLRYLSIKPYHWRGLWKIPRYRDKLRRVVGQFGPYVWIDFNWRPKASLKRWFGVVAVTATFLLAELGNFYLKFILWIPPNHNLCLLRILMFAAIGAVSMREIYQFLDDPHCQQFGRQAWVMACVIITETLLVIKFDPVTVSKPLPPHMQLFWLGLIASLLIWTIWHFGFKGIRVSINGTPPEPPVIEGSPTPVRNGHKDASRDEYLQNKPRRRRSTSSPHHRPHGTRLHNYNNSHS